jgi:hypothetical protein
MRSARFDLRTEKRSRRAGPSLAALGKLEALTIDGSSARQRAGLSFFSAKPNSEPSAVGKIRARICIEPVLAYHKTLYRISIGAGACEAPRSENP